MKQARRTCKELRSGIGFDHRDLHAITQGGENADQEIARYMLNIVVQIAVTLVREVPARFAISA